MSITNDFHPDFPQLAESNALVLISEEGTRFAVPAAALTRVSSWFRTMLTLPQSSEESTCAEPLAMTETTEILRYVVAYACGVKLPELDSASQIDAILHAADKYEMPGLTSIMRIALRNVPGAVAMRPVQRYVMAARQGWEDIRKDAETTCLVVSIDFDVPDNDFIFMKPLLQLQVANLKTQKVRGRHGSWD